MTGYSLQPSKLKSISFSLSQLFLIFWKSCLWVLPAKEFQKAKLLLENNGMEFASKLPKNCRNADSLKYPEIRVDMEFLCNVLV